MKRVPLWQRLNEPDRPVSDWVLTEALLEKRGEEWLRQNEDVILEQWETMLSLGI